MNRTRRKKTSDQESSHVNRNQDSRSEGRGTGKAAYLMDLAMRRRKKREWWLERNSISKRLLWKLGGPSISHKIPFESKV